MVSLQTEKVSFAAIHSWIQSVMQPTCEDGTTASGNTRSRRASESAEARKWRRARVSVLSETTSCVGKSGGEGEALSGTI